MASTGTAEVTAVAVDPADPRKLRIRPLQGTSDAVAYLAGGLTLSLGPGALVVFERLGTRLIVRGTL